MTALLEALPALAKSSEEKPAAKEGLRQAFELFNEMSQQLSDSYNNLENQVQALTGELAEVSAARMRELKEKESLAQRLNSLLQLLPGGVVVLDGQGYVQECNAAARDLLASQNLTGQSWRQVIKQAFSPKDDDGHEVSLKSGKRLSIQTSSLKHEPGQIVLMTDQTHTRELQAKLARHQRLTAMGKMVASLAHQVRTPLSGAMLYSQHLADHQLDAQTRQTFSKKLSRQLKNIEAQVRDMLIFAKGSAPLNQLLNQQDLVALISETKQILRKQYMADIDIINEHSDALVQCHQESLIGAIQNLMSNGIEAAEEAKQKPKLTVRLRQHKGYLCISVADNGPGINEQMKHKLTEPFFTSKSNGTGLGLPVVNGVVRAHHGRLSFHNQKAGGACFVMALPLSSQSKHFIQE